MRHFVWRVSYKALAVTRQSMSTESTLLQKWGSVVLWISNSKGEGIHANQSTSKEEGQDVCFESQL